MQAVAAGWAPLGLLLGLRATHAPLLTCGVRASRPPAPQVLELEPGNSAASKTVQRLEPVVAERREKLKEEMMGERWGGGMGRRADGWHSKWRMWLAAGNFVCYEVQEGGTWPACKSTPSVRVQGLAGTGPAATTGTLPRAQAS